MEAKITATVPEVARVMGVPEAKIRKWLRQGSVSYGKAFPKKDRQGKTPRFDYIIYVRKFLDEVGLEEWPGEEKTKV